MSEKQNSIFLFIVAFCYALAIVLSFMKIYVFRAYPIYYDAEEIPDFAGEIQTAITEWHL